MRIDDPVDISIDTEIQSMIDASVEWLETKTNFITSARDKKYFPTSDDGCGGDLRIYDFPINSIPAEYRTEEKNGYTLVHSNGDIVTANVGYTDPNDVPAWFDNAVLMLLKYWFYESEKQTNTTMVPDGVKKMVETYRRYTI